MDFAKLQKRSEIGQIFDSKMKEGSEVSFAGWVYDKRALGKIKFLLIKDITGLIQVTAVSGKVSEEIFRSIDKVIKESVVYVKGVLKDSKQAPGGKELIPSEFEIISESLEPIIDVSDYSKTELPKRLDNRFLDFHRKKTQAIFKIQTEISGSFKEFFYKKGYIEMQPPCIIGASSEGGTDLFKVKYFEKDAYLAQSPQLYKQMVACSMEKTFMITPVWRAEKHNTTRHINEIRQMDIEIAFAGVMDVMKIQEEVVKFIVKNVIEKCSEELKLLEVVLKIPSAKYFGFDEVKELLKKEGIKIPEGDLTPEAERKLGELFPDTIVFVYKWPLAEKPFYIMPTGEKADAKLSEGFDAIYKGVEISSGGQRIHLPELLEKRLKAKGLNPKDFKDYIDSFRYGAPPHAGWSLGLERMTQMICGLDNIKEATMFPRDRDRLNP